MDIHTEEPVRSPLMHMKERAPLLYRIFVFYFAAEFLTIFIIPFILPETTYLSLYLSNKAKEKTRLFFKNENSLIPDELAGWKNRPGMSRKNWVIDQHGSRATHDFSFQKQKPVRVMFLGSSMINGGTRITNKETISAYLEDAQIETLNFGTMMYSLDQVLLTYQDRLHRFNPDIIVVGIDIEPIAGLKNHYIPFRMPAEENVPYIKPRFELHSEKLNLIRVSAQRMLENIPENEALISFLSENDAFYYKFSSFCHMGMLPGSSGVRYIYLKTHRLLRYFKSDPQGELLLKAIVKQIRLEAKKHGASALFLMNTDETTLLQSGIHGYLKDLYEHELSLLKSSGARLIDVRAIFRESRMGSSALFDPDHSHYSAKGNKVIAEALKKEIHKETGILSETN